MRDPKCAITVTSRPMQVTVSRMTNKRKHDKCHCKQPLLLPSATRFPITSYFSGALDWKVFRSQGRRFKVTCTGVDASAFLFFVFRLAAASV